MGLEANNFLYETLLQEVQRRAAANDPQLLSLLEETAAAAHWDHPGRFADGALENILLRIGRELPPAEPREPFPGIGSRGKKSRTLHVVSELGSIGGHSRILTKWIQRDPSSAHAIVITRQMKAPPDFLVKIWEEREAPFMHLNPGNSLLDGARRLRKLAAGFDRVILHHRPNDSIPVLAFARPGGCPVAMFNHAHFWFSFGSTVSDVIINTMPYFQGLTRRHRFPRHTALLLGSSGLEAMHGTVIDKAAAKEQIGFPPNRPVAVTIGWEHYFKPMGDYDFFRTAAKLLERHSELHLLMIGVPENSALVPTRLRQTGRVHLLGPVSDPGRYYRAADLSLECFPMSSLGGFGETVAYGEAFPVPTYGPGENVLRQNQRVLARHFVRAETEEAYLDFIATLLTDLGSARAKAAELRKFIIDDDAIFGDQFAELYRQIDALPHQPREIPATECCREPDNHLLAALGDARLGRHFDRLLPAPRACLAHARAARRGHEPPHEAAARIARVLLRWGRRAPRPATIPLAAK